MVQHSGIELVEKNGSMSVKTTNVYYETFQKLLARGSYKDLKKRAETGVSASAQPLEKFSPNNVRRVILGLDGIFVQFYVGSSEFQAKQQFQPVNVTEQLIFELVAPNTKSTPVLKVLHGDRKTVMGDRIFSSIEEIIVLNATPNFGGTFNNSGIEWFVDTPSVKSSFKRLRVVTRVLTPISVADFIEQHKELLDNPLRLVTQDCKLEMQASLLAGDDYVTRTSLRPQYYKMDEADGALAKYFERTKDAYYKALVDRSKGTSAKGSDSAQGIDASSLVSVVDFACSFLEDFVVLDKLSEVKDYGSALRTMNTAVSYFISKAKESGWDTSVGYSGQASGSDFENLGIVLQLGSKNLMRFDKDDVVQLQVVVTSLAYVSYNWLTERGVKDKEVARFVNVYNKFPDNLDSYAKYTVLYGSVTRELFSTVGQGIEGEVDLSEEELTEEVAEPEILEEVKPEVEGVTEPEVGKTGLEHFAEIVGLHDTGRVRPTMDELYLHLHAWVSSQQVVTPDEVLHQVNDFLGSKREFVQAFNYIYKKHGVRFKGDGKGFANLRVMFGGSTELTNENVFSALKGIFKHEVPEVQRDLGAIFEKAERLARGEEI